MMMTDGDIISITYLAILDDVCRVSGFVYSGLMHEKK